MCAACGRDMRLSRVVEREYGGYTLNSFECQPCRIYYTRAAYEDDQGSEVGGQGTKPPLE
jgi:hypothetical protein